MTPFSERLTMALSVRHISMTELAQMMDVSKQCISAWAAGTRRPKTASIRYLAEKLGVSDEWLATGHTSDEQSLNPIVERIRERRKALGLSYQELADRTGMTKSTLQRYETGEIHNIPLHRLQSLVDGLSTKTEWLLGLDNSANSPTAFELNLLKQYNRAPVNIRKAINALLEIDD